MKLYYKAGACSLSPHIVLREADLDFTLTAVNLSTKKTELDEDYLQINPKGQVPALVLDDGTLLTEGPVIVQYIADQKPDRQLLPDFGTPARYHALEWLNYIGTELHRSLSTLFNSKTPDDFKNFTREGLMRKFAFVNQSLEDKHFLLGSRFSVADAYLFTMLTWAKVLKFDLSGLQALSEYKERVASRPAVDAALMAEGLKQ